MAARTYVDAVCAVRAWINSRTGTLVGVGNPLAAGAHFKFLTGNAPQVYAYLQELPGRVSDDSPENPDMMATVSAQVYGGTREAATAGAVALAEEVSTELCGCQAAVPGAILWVADDIQGPMWTPGPNDLPCLTLQFTVRARPA
jgi:hypothetical protein